MLANEAGNEVIAVIVVRAPIQRQRVTCCYVPVYLRIGGGCLYRERRERIFELHRKERGIQRT
jgi:hypothetical protein